CRVEPVPRLRQEIVRAGSAGGAPDPGSFRGGKSRVPRDELAREFVRSRDIVAKHERVDPEHLRLLIVGNEGCGLLKARGASPLLTAPDENTPLHLPVSELLYGTHRAPTESLQQIELLRCIVEQTIVDELLHCIQRLRRSVAAVDVLNANDDVGRL